MTGKQKPTAREAFDLNIADAEKLILVAKALRNNRIRKTRRELRERVGEALRIPRKSRDSLECIESDDLFVVLKPDGVVQRNHFDDLRPLLRQAIVAGCAAAETFVADRVMELLGPALRAKDKPRRLMELKMTVADWFRIDAYSRRGWGLRELVEEQIRRQIVSPSPGQIGIAFSLVGVDRLWSKVDGHRRVGKGDSERAMDAIYSRRNRIAHEGDRLGRGRATIEIEEVEGDLACLAGIVNALDKVTSPLGATSGTTTRA
ncbi:MAG: hypothetical protein ACR2NT_02020 [Acidimicrobiia bacterium]